VVNLSKYAPLAQADLQRIVADWKTRDPRAAGWKLVDSAAQTEGKLYLVSFTVDGVSQGGLVWVPASGEKLPLILFGHPDDAGVDGTYASMFLELMGSVATRAIVVFPAYRGETASLGGSAVASFPAAQSPWDRDVDDALAMLWGAAAHVSQADTARIAAVGYSRGAGVSLLAALRDSRIGSVFEIAGPTDFFSPSIQAIAMDLKDGKEHALPGLDVIDASYLKPFWRGSISADSLRRELLARSAARLALSKLLPATEAVHGSADATVSPDQSQALKEADKRVAYDEISGMTHSSFLSETSQQAAIAIQLQAFLKAHLFD
jgi:hypothetical protein